MSSLSHNEYLKKRTSINNLAASISTVILDSQIEASGELIADSAVVQNNLEHAIGGSIFDELGEDGAAIATIAVNSVRQYIKRTGHEPAPEVMASVANSIQNIMDSTKSQGILDSESLATSAGVPFRNHTIAMQMPATLAQVTLDDVTVAPAGYDKAEIFHVERVAGSTFGDYTKGEVLDEHFSGQYGTMDVFKSLGTTDGTTTTFSVNYGSELKGGRTMVYIDNDLVVSDLNEESGSVDVIAAIDGGTVTLKRDLTNGGVTVELTAGAAAALGAGLPVEVKADYKIEGNESIIPLVDHHVKSYLLRPHEAALASSVTIIGTLLMQREHGLNQNTMNIAAAADLLAAEKDRRNISMMYRAARHRFTWGTKPDSAGNDATVQHMQLLRAFLSKVSLQMVSDNKKAGIQSIYVGLEALALLKTLPASDFTMVAGYRESAQPHVVGRLFGQYTVKCAPQLNGHDMLCVAKGKEYGDAGLIVGDAIPAMHMKHFVQFGKLNHENTLYELALRDIHPKNGRNFFSVITLDPASSGQQ